VIEVSGKGRDMVLVLEAAQSPERDVPDYIEADHSKMRATYQRVPQLSDVPYPVQMEPNLVVEFYSR
jgi:small subunit ribosomal protein S4